MDEGEGNFVLDGVVLLLGVVESELFGLEELSSGIFTFWRKLLMFSMLSLNLTIYWSSLIC